MHTTARLGDTLATVAAFTSTTGQDRCHRQWISRPMAAGNVFNTSVTYKAYAQVLESAANDNIITRLGVRIVSEDGSTVRHTVLAVANYGNATEFNTALRNKIFADGDAGTGSYTTVDGDRLVVEWGHNDSAGASISASSRWGSTGTTIADLPENETSTSTTERPWFETSLDITFKAPTVVDRYVNTASTAGGNGTTNLTAGATRAWASLAEVIPALQATDWPTANQQVRVNFSGTTADAPSSTNLSGTIHSAPDCYVEFLGNATNALQWDTSAYRVEPLIGVAAFLNQGILYFRISRFQVKANPPTGATGHNAFNMAAITTPEPGDVRIDRMYLDCVINNAHTGSGAGFATSSVAPNVKWTITNSIAANFRSTGTTMSGFIKGSGSTVDYAVYNCFAYNCGVGFRSQTNDLLAKNCGAVSCDDGWSGTLLAGSTNNASDLSADATGTNARNSVTPSFTSAGSNFHLQSGDTAWKDQGSDLSADARLPFSTDGDGETRSGTWDIGPDEYVATGTTFTQTVDGTLTSAGAIVRAGRKTPAGTMATAGAVVRFTAKTPAGTLTTAGAAVRRASKTTSGTLTTAGTVALRGGKVVAGTLASSGALTQASVRPRTVSGTLATAGALTRRGGKAVAGTLASSGTLSPRVGLKILVGSLSSSGALTPSALKVATLAGTLSSSGALVRIPGKVLLGVLAESGALSRVDLKVLSAALSSSGTLSPRVGLKILVGVLAPSGALTPVAVKVRTVDGTLATAGALVRRTSVAAAGALLSSGALTRSDLKALAGTLATSGTVAPRVGLKILVGVLSTSGAVTPLSLKARALSGTLSTAGALSRISTRTPAGTLTSSGALARRDLKALQGALAPAGGMTMTRVSLLALAGVLSPAGAITRREAKVMSAVLGSSGALNRRSTRPVAGTLSSAGALSRGTRMSLAGVLTPGPGEVLRSVAFGVPLGGVLAPTGVLSRDVARSLAGVLSFVGDLDIFTGDIVVFLDVDAPVTEGMRWVAAVVEGWRWEVPVVEGFRYTVPIQDD